MKKVKLSISFNSPVAVYRYFKLRPNVGGGGTLNASNYSQLVQYQLTTCPAFSADYEVAGMFRLEPGSYVIVPCTYQPGAEKKFLLRVFTETETDARCDGGGGGLGVGYPHIPMGG